MDRNDTLRALSRRGLLATSAAVGTGIALTGRRGLLPPALAAGRTLTMADVGVGDRAATGRSSSSRAATKSTWSRSAMRRPRCSTS